MRNWWNGPPWKKQSNDIHDLEENRQKRLDKVDNLLYNIRTRVVEDMKFIEIDPHEYTANAARTLECLKGMARLEEALGVVNRKTGKDAFLAGGYVRDALLGTPPKDLDVFIPVSEGDDLDDEAVWYGELLREATKALHGVQYPLFTKRGQEAYANSPFTVYESNMGYRAPARPIQLIPHVSPDAETILRSFDHNLVRVYYKGGKVFVNDEFPEIMKKKTIVVGSEAAFQRLDTWRRRVGYKISIRRGFKQTKKEKAELFTTSTASTLNTIWLDRAVAFEQAAQRDRQFFDDAHRMLGGGQQWERGDPVEIRIER